MAEKTKKAKSSETPKRAKKSAPVAEVTPIAVENHVSTDTKPARVTHEEIARLAHRFWIERGRQHGRPEDDWLRAEQELRAKAS